MTNLPLLLLLLLLLFSTCSFFNTNLLPPLKRRPGVVRIMPRAFLGRRCSSRWGRGPILPGMDERTPHPFGTAFRCEIFAELGLIVRMVWICGFKPTRARVLTGTPASLSPILLIPIWPPDLPYFLRASGRAPVVCFLGRTPVVCRIWARPR